MGDWQWFGHPGHFCAAEWCLFHLHTHVGKWCVSTVGDYWPPPLDGEKKQQREIGHGRTFETMVFELNAEGEPHDWRELDFNAYDDRDAANAGHIEKCKLWETIVEAPKRWDDEPAQTKEPEDG